MVNRDDIRFVGVDGCPYGWLAVGLSQNGGCETNVFRTFKELLAHYAGAELILVDMPIGLPDGREERRCDVQARTRLNQNGARRGSTVFRAPTRTAVEYLAQNPHIGVVVNAVGHELAQTVQQELNRAVQHNIAQDVEQEVNKAVRYAITKGIQREITGVRLSLQTLEITPKIAEVDNLLPRNEPPYIREVHPEICFQALNGGNPIVPAKSTPEGEDARIESLSKVGVPAQEIFDTALDDLENERRCQVPAVRRNRWVMRDDILDALVAAVTAREGNRHGFQQVQGSGEIDGKGLTMEMVYWRP